MLGAAAVGAAANAAPPPEPPDAEDPGASTRLVPIPPGCPQPVQPDLAFVGEVIDKDGYIDRGAVRFRLAQLRAGSAVPHATDGIIDVRYGPDSKYLEIGEEYLVSAAIDPDIGRLASTVSPEAPLFGGNDVIGVDDTAIECPELENAVVTLHVDGSSIESGVLTPLFRDSRVLLATIGVPAAVVGVVLIALVVLRWASRWFMGGVFALGRAATTPTVDHRAARVRRHGTSGDAADATADPRQVRVRRHGAGSERASASSAPGR